jgi:hypothetical protein
MNVAYCAQRDGRAHAKCLTVMTSQAVVVYLNEGLSVVLSWIRTVRVVPREVQDVGSGGHGQGSGLKLPPLFCRNALSS